MELVDSRMFKDEMEWDSEDKQKFIVNGLWFLEDIKNEEISKFIVKVKKLPYFKKRRQKFYETIINI